MSYYSGPTTIMHPPMFAAYADPSPGQFPAYGLGSPYLESEAFDDPEIDYHLGDGLYMEEDALEALDGLWENVVSGVTSFNPWGIALVLSGGSLIMSHMAKGKKKKQAGMGFSVAVAIASLYALNKAGEE